MKVSKILLPVFVILFLTTGCYTYKDIEITKFNGITPLELSATSMKIQLDLEIVNPNNYSVTLKQHQVCAYINQKNVGEVRVQEEVKFPPNSTQRYLFTLAPDATKVMPILPSLFFSKSIEGRLLGKVKIKAGCITKNIDIDLSKKIELQDFGL